MQNSSIFSGPQVLPPHPTHLLVMLHGFGADGHDLLALAAPLKAALGKLGEGLAVVAPNAPTPTPQGQGLQWFRDMGWTFRDPAGLTSASLQLQATLQALSQQHHIPPQHIAMLGFSQGAMLLLHALPSLQPTPAAIISIAGALTVTPSFTTATAHPPVLLLHGTADDVLPADTSVTAANILATATYPTQLELIPALGHGINAACLAEIAVFLQQVWTPAA